MKGLYFVFVIMSNVSLNLNKNMLDDSLTIYERKSRKMNHGVTRGFITPQQTRSAVF